MSKSTQGQDSAEWSELVEFISDLSEEAYAASWMEDIEYDLWDRIENGPAPYGRLEVTIDHIQRLVRLSKSCGGWVRYHSELGEVFVPLGEWETMYKAKRR